MWLAAAAVLYLGGSWAWSKYIDPPPKKGPAQKDLELPRTDEGAVVSLTYGRCRVDAPILAWVGTPWFLSADAAGVEITNPAFADIYACSLYLIIGIPFEGGANKIHSMWAGDAKFQQMPDGVALSDLIGDGAIEDTLRPCFVSASLGNSYTGGKVEFLNGNGDQTLVDGSGTPTTRVGRWMTVTSSSDALGTQGDIPAENVPGYRGFLSVFLYNSGNTAHWLIGTSPQVPRYSFEVSSYATTAALAARPAGDDENPVNILYDICRSEFAKLGLDPDTEIDVPNWVTVATTCQQEGLGYSRCFKDVADASEIVGEILTYMDAVMYEDQATGKLKIKLLRNDYEPSAVPKIDKSNCSKVEMTASGWSDLPNKVRVTFPNRSKDYQPDSVAVQNLANVAAEGTVREEVFDAPGCCTKALATALATRLLAQLSRPLMSGSVVVDRSFENVNPGDVVKLTWPRPLISGLFFRVTSVDRGTLADGEIRLGLIQDVNYVWRLEAPLPPWRPPAVLNV